MFCNTNQFPSLPFCGPYTKPHGVRGLSKHYHVWFDITLGHGICAILHILCACVECTFMLDKPWIPGLTPNKQLCYWPVTDCSESPVIGSFNNWKIITLSHKDTISEAFEEICKVALDGISYNMASLDKFGKYGTMNTIDTSTTGYYLTKFFSEAYTLQEDTTYNRLIILVGKIVLKTQYISCMQENPISIWSRKISNK